MLIPALDDGQMQKELNYFLGIPLTVVMGMDIANVSARSYATFRPTYLVIPRQVAIDFEILDLKVGKNSQFVSCDSIHASVFSGEVIVLKDKLVEAVVDLPLAMKMDICRPDMFIHMLVRNMNPAARNFYGAIVGPPLGEREVA